MMCYIYSFEHCLSLYYKHLYKPNMATPTNCDFCDIEIFAIQYDILWQLGTIFSEIIHYTASKYYTLNY